MKNLSLSGNFGAQLHVLVRILGDRKEKETGTRYSDIRDYPTFQMAIRNVQLASAKSPWQFEFVTMFIPRYSIASRSTNSVELMRDSRGAYEITRIK